MLGTILRHDVRKLVIHILLHASSRIALLRGLLTYQLGPNRTLCRERLHHGLGLELNHSFRQDGVEHPACTGPRLRAVLHLEAKQLKPIYVGLYPVLAARNVLVKLTGQVASQLHQHALVERLGQVLVEVAFTVVLITGFEDYLHVAVLERNPFRVLNLDLKRGLIAHHSGGEAHGGLA